jgi:pimeloyl-ACP methyl ester carboxylesterase
MRNYTLLFLSQALLAICVLTAAPVSAAPAPTASFEAGSVHVDQYGTGSPALVLIPGLTDSGAVWEATVARYQGAHTIYVLTLPGFGGRAPIAAPMLDTVTGDIAAFLPRANKPVVIGHSLGGFLAIRLAEEHGDLLRGAVAIDGLPVFAGMDTLTQQQRAAIAAEGANRIRNASPAAFDASERAQIAYMTKPANVATAVSFSHGADQGATAAYMQELLGADLRPQLSRITVPLLEIAPFDASVDAQNPYHPMTSSQEKKAYYAGLLAGDPTATVIAIDDSRHFVMLDRPAALYAAIDAFLAKLR